MGVLQSSDERTTGVSAPASQLVPDGTPVADDVGDVTDVTALLRRSEVRFRSLFDQSPLSIQVFEPDGTPRAVNRAWERLFGVTLADIPDYNILRDRQLEERGVMPAVRRAFAGEPAAIPAIPYVPDRGAFQGQERWCEAFIYPVRDEHGRIDEVVLIHQDMTDHQKTLDRLLLYREIFAH